MQPITKVTYLICIIITDIMIMDIMITDIMITDILIPDEFSVMAYLLLT